MREILGAGALNLSRYESGAFLDEAQSYHAIAEQALQEANAIAKQRDADLLALPSVLDHARSKLVAGSGSLALEDNAEDNKPDSGRVSLASAMTSGSSAPRYLSTRAVGTPLF